MRDLLILELIISALLFVYIVRPFVRRFRGVDGLSALPALSFLLVIAVFPSFGFRPEILPLAVFAFFAFIASLPRLLDIARGLRTDDYGESRPLLALAFLVLLIASCVFALAFMPSNPPQARMASPVRFEATDESRKATLEMLLEGVSREGGAGPLPLVVFGPPVLGSSEMTDTFRAELAAKGYAILTYTRPGLDFPALDASGRIRLPQAHNARDALVSLLWGRRFAFAAEAGARLEKERLDDLRFTIEYVRSRAAADERFKNVDISRMAIAGYGASGAAALIYGAEADPAVIRSIIAIESPVASYLSVEVKDQGSPKGAKSDSTIFGSAVRFFGALKRALTVRSVLGPIRGNEAAQAVKVPTMLLVSDWIRDVSMRDGRYATLVSVMRFSKAPCSIVSIAGAGLVQYADVHSDYPVYAFFAQGRDKFIPHSTPFAPRAAALSASFMNGSLSQSNAGVGVLIEKNK